MMKYCVWSDYRHSICDVIVVTVLCYIFLLRYSFIPDHLPSENNYRHYSLFNETKSLDFGRPQFHSSYKFLYYRIIFVVNSAL